MILPKIHICIMARPVTGVSLDLATKNYRQWFCCSTITCTQESTICTLQNRVLKLVMYWNFHVFVVMFKFYFSVIIFQATILDLLQLPTVQCMLIFQPQCIAPPPSPSFEIPMWYLLKSPKILTSLLCKWVLWLFVHYRLFVCSFVLQQLHFLFPMNSQRMCSSHSLNHDMQSLQCICVLQHWEKW